MTPRQVLTREYLEEHFVRQAKTHRVIARELGLKSSNSVAHYIKKYGLKRPPIRDAGRLLTREYLEEHYVRQQKGMQTIASQLSVRGKGAVRRALRRHNIPVREDSVVNEAMKTSWRRRRGGCGDMSGRFWYSIKCSARYRSIEFSISQEFVWSLFEQQGRRCVLSGLPLKFNGVGEPQSETTASLDRVNSDKGYTKGNVQWVHKRIQKMKWELGQEEFITMCRLVAHHNSGSNQ